MSQTRNAALLSLPLLPLPLPLLLPDEQFAPAPEPEPAADTPTKRPRRARSFAQSPTKAHMERVLWFTFSSVFYFDPALIADYGDFTSTTERDAAKPVEPLGYDCLPPLVMNEAMRPLVATVKEQGSVLQAVHPVLALALDTERGFNTLNYDERLVITHRFGLKRSFDEIGDTIRYEPQTVRKILNRAIEKLAPFIVSLAQLEGLPVYSDATTEAGAEAGAANPTGINTDSRPTSRTSTGTGKPGKHMVLDASSSARERRKLAGQHEKLRQELRASANENYQVIEGERFWERDSDSAGGAHEAGQAESQQLSYVEKVSQKLFSYLRRDHAVTSSPAHGATAVQPETGVTSETGAAGEELFYMRGYGYRREVLMTKLYQMASNSTYTAEQIIRKLFDPHVTSGVNSVRFASEFGFNYGDVVRVKRDFLARLVDWAGDGDIAVRYAASKQSTPALVPAQKCVVAHEAELPILAMSPQPAAVA